MNIKTFSISNLSFFLAIVFISVACGRQSGLFPEGKDIFGLASAITLAEGETEIVLNDFFHSGSLSNIDSVSVHPSLRARLSDDRRILVLQPRNLNVPAISELTVWLDGAPYSIVLRRSARVEHTFRFYQGENRFRNVAIRGQMTDWMPEPMILVDGVWQLSMRLNPGQYEYLIVTDGRDINDPENPMQVSNNAGGYNSLLVVGNLDRTDAPRIVPVRQRAKTVELELINDPDQVIALWQNFRIPLQNIRQQGNRLSIAIPKDARKQQRSFIRIKAARGAEMANDLLIPLEFGRPVTDPALLTREDREATIMYFLMVDRFRNGNTDRDDPVDDPEVAPRANFYGGDLDGVLEKIQSEYFSNLGVNAVWFSPISQNPLRAYVEFPEPRRKFTGYHGYWPITLTTIDHRFGDDEVLEKLVKEAHARDISVLLDFVSNHVHQDNPLIIENPHWATPLILPDGRKNIRIWEEHRLTTWFDDFLPSLDFSQPGVIETMVDSAFYWLDRFNLDGFRHDATKHVPFEFWRALTKKIKEDKMFPDNKRLFQIGETFGSHELISSYVGSGMLDGKFDFNLYWDSRAVFATDDQPFQRLDHSLHQSFSYYGFQNLMGNITGNHDMPRFISLAGGDLGFDENATEAGWQRDIVVGDPVGYKRLSALNAFIMTAPGIPVIYYGDEIGIPGGNDPDSRRPMIFENLTPQQQEVKDNVKQLTRIRSHNLALIYGDFTTLVAQEHLYAYARRYFDNKVIVVFNKSGQDEQVELSLPAHLANTAYRASFGAVTEPTANGIRVHVPANGFEILVY